MWRRGRTKSFNAYMLTIFVAISSLIADESVAAWVPADFSLGKSGISLNEVGFGYRSSQAVHYPQRGSAPPGGNLCESLSKCSEEFPESTIQTTFWMPLCDARITFDCVESLLVKTLSSSSPEFSYSTLTGPEVDSSEILGIFGGSGPVLATGARNYLIRAQLNYNIFKGEVFSSSILADVVPVDLVEGPQFTEIRLESRSGITEVGGSRECAWTAEGKCWKQAALDAENTLSLSLRLSTRWSGYFRSRLQSPEIEFEEKDGYSRVQVAGQPQSIQRLFFETDASNWSEEEKSTWCEDVITECILPMGGMLISNSAANPRAFKLLELLRQYANDTARAMEPEWSFRMNKSSGSHPCLAGQSGLIGIVSTNAPVIEDEFPSFSEGFLNYRVAGLHFAPGGASINLGTYDLVMRSDTARCLYGFTKAPVSATVTVVGNDGAENIAATVVSERDGWLKLAAYGFTFSEKEIKVRITQPQIRTLSLYSGRATALTNTQKAQIRATLAKSDGSTKFICTGIRYFDQPVTENILVRKRAKLACDYAKSLRPDLSYWFQTKTTQARSYNGRVLVVSK